MSMISKVEEGLKQLYGQDYNASEDFPAEAKVMIGVIEQEFNIIKHRLSALEGRNAPRPVAPPPVIPAQPQS